MWWRRRTKYYVIFLKCSADALHLVGKAESHYWWQSLSELNKQIFSHHRSQQCSGMYLYVRAAAAAVV